MDYVTFSLLKRHIDFQEEKEDFTGKPQNL